MEIKSRLIVLVVSTILLTLAMSVVLAVAIICENFINVVVSLVMIGLLIYFAITDIEEISAKVKRTELELFTAKEMLKDRGQKL